MPRQQRRSVRFVQRRFTALSLVSHRRDHHVDDDRGDDGQCQKNCSTGDDESTLTSMEIRANSQMMIEKNLNNLDQTETERESVRSHLFLASRVHLIGPCQFMRRFRAVHRRRIRPIDRLSVLLHWLN